MRPFPLLCLLTLGCPPVTTPDPTLVDADGDGFPVEEDCDDGDAGINPGAGEVCNGLDDDCDGAMDEGWPDVNADGLAECSLACPMVVDAAAAPGGVGSPEAPFATIGDALAWLAPDCARVEVGPGTYAERVDFGERDLELVATAGPEVTVIDAGGAGTVVTIAGGQGSESLLQGFTLTGGSGTWGDGADFSAHLQHGGGLVVSESDPTVVGNIIAGNTTTGRGAGAVLFRYDGLFTGNVVRDNTAALQSGYAGAGLYLRYGDPIVWGNEITGNVALAADGIGGGILARGGDPWIVANRVQGNLAGGSGGGLRTVSATQLVAANLVVENDPEGIVTSDGDDGAIVNNTTVGNATDGLKSFAGADYSGDGPATVFENNLSTGNGRYGFYVYGRDAIAVFQHNLLWGNARAEYAGLGDRTGRDGNLSEDPLLDGELRPTEGSPAIDAGIDAGGWGVFEDLDGTPRPQGAGWDIGAYEVE
ncbi:MAG: right-handed parallel beta-helix repeat-containing protein [Pseudomonadota bacterium]